MKKLIITIIIFSFYGSSAQITKSYEEQITHIYATVDKGNLKTGLFFEMGFPFQKLKVFNGNGSDILNCDDFYSAYAAIYTMHVNKQPAIPHFDTVLNQKTYSRAVPIKLLWFNYESLADSALQKGLIYIENNQVHINAKSKIAAIEQRTVFVALPFIDESKETTLDFIYTPEFFYTNIKQKPSEITIDFGDGKGHRTLKPNMPITIYYATAGLKQVSIKLNCKNGEVYQCHSQINICPIDIANSTKSYEIGGNTTFTCTAGANSAKVTIDYGESTNLTLDKPIIFVEGLDPSDKISDRSVAPLQDYNYFLNTKLDKVEVSAFKQNLQANGYDIVFVDFVKNTDYMQNNAMVLAEVIQEVNRRKTANAHKNIVVGMSMGGIISRYALKDMENKNINHDVSKFISFDSPQTGANQAIGSQNCLKDIYETKIFGVYIRNQTAGKTAKEAYELLDSPAPKQMLINHVNDNTTYSSFQNTLNTMGMPQKCANIAIANGSWNTKQGFNAGDKVIHYYSNDFAWDPVCDGVSFLNTYLKIAALAIPFYGLAAATSSVQFNIDIWAVIGNNTNQIVYEGYIREMLFGTIPIDWNPKRTCYFASKAAYDNAPSSYDEVDNNACSPELVYEAGFVTPSSAIGITPYDNATLYRNVTFSGIPESYHPLFDLWYVYEGVNTTHVEFNQRTTNILWEHINTATCTEIIIFSNRTLNGASDPYKRITGCKVKLDNITISNNCNFEVSYNNSLILEKSIKIDAGSIFKAGLAN